MAATLRRAVGDCEPRYARVPSPDLGYMQVVRGCNQYRPSCSNPATGYVLDPDLKRALKHAGGFSASGRAAEARPADLRAPWLVAGFSEV